MTSNSYHPPLAGVRVVDLVTGPMQNVGRLLADLGADVIHVDLVGVVTKAPFGPVVGGVEVHSALARLGTPSQRIDRSTEAGAREWDALIASADVLIESTIPGSPEERALNVRGLHAERRDLLVFSISDFGRDTRFSRWQGSSPVFYALTSELSRTGEPGREPLLPPGDLPYDTAATQAVTLLLAAYLDRVWTGRGHVIDFSVIEGATAALDPAFGMAGSAALGRSLSSLPRGRTDQTHQYPIIPCKDGYVRICVLAKRQWHGMFEWMGRPQEFADPKFDNIRVRSETPSLIPAIAAFFADKTRAQLEDEAQRFGVPTAAVLSIDEALQTPQIKARGFLREVEVAPGMMAPVPVGIAEIDGVRASALNIQADPATQPAIARATVQAGTGLPLQGLKIIDFGIIIVGGDSTRILSDLGADVIKVEHPAFPDGSRASMPAGEMMPGFSSGHRNKRSIAINLQDADGLELAYRLISDADIVFSNWKPGTAQKLGLDYESLVKVNPDVIVVDSSAFGQSGPWSKRLGYGPLVRAATGFTEQWMYPDLPGRFQDDVTVYPDHVSARVSALLGLALMVRRESSGVGGWGSNAQAEVMMSHMAPALVASALVRSGHELQTPATDAPWGVFPAAGEDDWVVVTVRADDEWRALCEAIGRSDLLADPDLATAVGRDRQRERVNKAVAEWTALKSPTEAMELLQAAGIPAGVMFRGFELPQWEFYRLRRTFREESHPFANETFTVANVQIHAPSIPDPPMRPAPMLGEHTIEVVRERLCLTEDKIDDLVDRGVLEAPVLTVRS